MTGSDTISPIAPGHTHRGILCFTLHPNEILAMYMLNPERPIRFTFNPCIVNIAKGK